MAAEGTFHGLLGGRASRTEVLCAALVLAVAVGAAGTILVRGTAWKMLSRPSITLASTSVILIALAGGGLRSWYGRLVTIGLCFCWIGDHVPGLAMTIAAFLVGHLCFIAAFWVRGLRAKACLLAGGLVAVASSAICLWIIPHVRENLLVPVLAYIVVISAMVVFAGGARPGKGRLMLAIAAVAFYASDTLLARSIFISSESWSPISVFGPYYTACALFALSVLAYQRERAGQDRSASLDRMEADQAAGCPVGGGAEY
ncbi:MAG: lysoplasmalogenase [Phycisphaerae bacterium]|nr:lysoplasmalogenase [Phycisphaerae bacterium]